MFDEKKALDLARLKSAQTLISALLIEEYIDCLDENCYIAQGTLLKLNQVYTSQHEKLSAELEKWKRENPEEYKEGISECKKSDHIGEWHHDILFNVWHRICPRCGETEIRTSTPSEIFHKHMRERRSAKMRNISQILGDSGISSYEDVQNM